MTEEKKEQPLPSKPNNHEEFEEGAKVSPLENLVDIVVAMAIHWAADRTKNGSWIWYILRVYWVYDLWSLSVVFANIVNLLSKNKAGFLYHAIGFATMAVWLSLIQMTQSDDNFHSSAIACAGHFILIFLVAMSTTVKRPAWVDAERYARFKTLAKFAYVGAFVACAPVFFALVNTRNHDDESVIIYANYSSMFLAQAMKYFVHNEYDKLGKKCHSIEGVALDLNHVTERYEMIVFALLGELFYVTADPSTYYQCLLSLVTAMSCFLLYFSARVDGRIEGWRLSALSVFAIQTEHLAMFYVIPKMGLAFVEVISGQAEEDLETDHNPQQDLCYSAAAFLIIMSAMESMTQDPAEPKARFPLTVRLSLNVASAGVLVSSRQFADASVVVPTVLMATALTQVWGVQERDGLAHGRKHPKKAL